MRAVAQSSGDIGGETVFGHGAPAQSRTIVSKANVDEFCDCITLKPSDMEALSAKISWSPEMIPSWDWLVMSSNYMTKDVGRGISRLYESSFQVSVLR